MSDAKSEPREFWTDGDELYSTTWDDTPERFQLVPMSDYQALQSELANLNEKLREAIKLLHTKKWHDDDCANRKENFKEYENCECGAESIKQFLRKIEEIGK